MKTTLMILQCLLPLSFSYANYVREELGEEQKMNVIMKEQSQKDNNQKALANSWFSSSLDDNYATTSENLKVCILLLLSFIEFI